MSEQQSQTATAVQDRPAPDGLKSWPEYWKAQGMPWRTEPEIDEERQQYLAERRAIQPDIEKGIYPFRDIKLDRADVEWLLATHENGQWPSMWGRMTGDLQKRGPDLRGANLREADLHRLPLMQLRAGLAAEDWTRSPNAQLEASVVHLGRCAKVFRPTRRPWDRALVDGNRKNFCHFT